MDVGRAVGTAAALGMFATLIFGCSGTPFKDREQVRSPYERYQVLRGEGRPRTVTDSFGREQPALRQRLAPLDSR